MVNHPARQRIAEVLVTRAGEPGRGSGYLLAPGWVLTAAHVVADVEAAAVWLGAPPILDTASGTGVELRHILMAPHADLALVPVNSGKLRTQSLYCSVGWIVLRLTECGW